MFMNLLTLRNELADRLKNTEIGTTRLNRWVNLAQDDIATLVDCDHLETEIFFSSVANQRKYYLPIEFNKILSVLDLTNNRELYILSEAQLESFDPDRSESGTPSHFSIFGYSWVKAQPTSASAVSIVSSSTSDTVEKVRINGKVNGVEDTEILTLNGTTTVTGTKSFTEIFSIVKASTTVGKITATSNSGAVTLTEIAPGELHSEYQPLDLWPLADGAFSYRVRGHRRPRKMINDQDFPDLPSSYHEAVLVSAEIRGHIDLFRPQLAEKIKQNVLEGLLDKIERQMGNKRRKRSVVIQGGIMPEPLYFRRYDTLG